MDFFAGKIASRLGGADFDRNPDSYNFARIKKAREEARALRPEIPLINMGVGEPDIPADPAIVRILAEEAGKSRNRFYADNGILEFQEAAATYMERVYGIGNLNPGENIMHGLGYKQILALLPSAFINPGDITFMTVPGYPIIGVNTVYLGGKTYNLPLYRENSFYSDFSAIPGNVLKKAKLLYINYPNNPTGQAATEEFYSDVVEFAYRNGIIVVSDAAYMQ